MFVWGLIGFCEMLGSHDEGLVREPESERQQPSAWQPVEMRRQCGGIKHVAEVDNKRCENYDRRRRGCGRQSNRYELCGAGKYKGGECRCSPRAEATGDRQRAEDHSEGPRAHQQREWITGAS